METKVLLVDDQAEVRDLIHENLEEKGYQVVEAADGREGLQAFFNDRPDLVVLDVLMPGMDGWELLERIREVSETPVVVLSALNREHQTVRGLRLGADDYMVKPVSRSEFLARVEAALRKTGQKQEIEDKYKDSVLVVDFARDEVLLEGDRISLTAKEFRLLSALVRNAGMLLSTDKLLDLCWGADEGDPQNVRVYIGYLRKKLKEDARAQRLIETVREFGYRYNPSQF